MKNKKMDFIKLLALFLSVFISVNSSFKNNKTEWRNSDDNVKINYNKMSNYNRNSLLRKF